MKTVNAVLLCKRIAKITKSGKIYWFLKTVYMRKYIVRCMVSVSSMGRHIQRKEERKVQYRWQSVNKLTVSKVSATLWLDFCWWSSLFLLLLYNRSMTFTDFIISPPYKPLSSFLSRRLRKKSPTTVPFNVRSASYIKQIELVYCNGKCSHNKTFFA